MRALGATLLALGLFGGSPDAQIMGGPEPQQARSILIFNDRPDAVFFKRLERQVASDKPVMLQFTANSVDLAQAGTSDPNPKITCTIPVEAVDLGARTAMGIKCLHLQVV